MEEFELFVVIAKRIWFRRNSVIYGGEFINPNQLARGATKSYEDYKKFTAQERGTGQRSDVVNHIKWEATLENKFKVN